MKVYMSNYPKGKITTFNWFKKYIMWSHPDKVWYDVDETEYTKRDRIVEKLMNFVDDVLLVPVNFVLSRWRDEQKIKVRIDPWDTWSLDHTLAHIIHPALIQLRDTNHGAGYVDDEDVPEFLRRDAADPQTEEEKANGRSDSLHFKRWEWVMNEMIFAFEKIKEGDWDYKLYTEEGGWTDEAFAKRDEIQKRISHGLKLFGKYYQGLWD